MRRLLTAAALAGLALLLDRRAGTAPGHVFTSGQDTPTTGYLTGDGAALASPAYPGLYGDADQDHRRAGIAPGHVIMSARSEPAPGFLACNGDQHPVAAYPALHDAIGDAYNDGDEDPGYFRVPNYTDRFPSGHDRGSSGGLAEGDTQDVVIPWSPVPAHVHDVPDHTHPQGGHTHGTPTFSAHSHPLAGLSGFAGSAGPPFDFYAPTLVPANTGSTGGTGTATTDTGTGGDTETDGAWDVQTGIAIADEETGDDTTVELEHVPPAYVGNNFEIKT